MEKTKSKKILVVEHNEFHRFFYSYVLSHYYSCPVQTTESGEKALRILGENYFDMVYVDVSVPFSENIKMLENLRYFYPEYSTPIIAITTDRDQDTLSRLISLGIKEYIIKPVGENNIFEKMGICFN